MNTQNKNIASKFWLTMICIALSLVGCRGKEKDLGGQSGHEGHIDDRRVRTPYGSVVDNNEGHERHDEHGGVHLSDQAILEAGIEVERLEPRQLHSSLELPGTLQPHPEGEGFVGSLVEGRIKEVFADIGDRVVEGEPLCIIESPTVGEVEAEYITAQAEHLFVKADLERHKTLVSEGIGSKKELLELEARVASTSSAVWAVERTLHAYGFNEEDVKKLESNHHSGGKVTLRSPTAGSVVNCQARVGMQVAPETDLFHVVEMRRLRVKLDIPEQKIGGIGVGQDVTVISQKGQRDEHKGKIERLGGSIEHETRTVTVFATVENSSGSLRPGAFVTVRLKLAGSGLEALVVPAEAVFNDEDGDQALFIEAEPGQFKMVEVETGAKANGFVEITSGIARGDRVVVKGAFAIKSEAAKSKIGDGHNH